MKTWLLELEKALKKYFYEDEVKDILVYYEEIINERLSNQEKLDEILSSYDIQKIVKDMIPEMLIKRKNKSYLQISKSTKLLFIVLLGSPILFPLAIVYVSILIFVVSMMATAGILLVASLVNYGIFMYDLLTSNVTFINALGLFGFSLMMISMLIFLSILIYQSMLYLWRKLIQMFTKLLIKRGEVK